MSHATHRQPLNAAHRSRLRPILSPARRSTSPAAAALVLCTARAIGDAEERADADFSAAVRLYEDGHWSFAFERLATLADRGHAPAAKLALLMLRYGSAFYGSGFSACPEQVARWAQRVLHASARAASLSKSIGQST